MHPDRKKAIAKVLLGLCPLAFGAAAIGMAARVEPFYSAFYGYAWWSYIFFVQAFLYIKGGRSQLFCEPQRFLLLLPLSVAVWLVFEAFNFRLGNWHYLNLPANPFIRWPGYFFAFATVLPGMFSTAALLEHFGAFKSSRLTPLVSPRKLYLSFYATGLISAVLPILWPAYFFPLVWGIFIFLLEPLNHRLGASSLLRDWENGTLGRFYLLLVSGLICGLLWEMWNFSAGSKWVYTVPYVHYFQIFEMPVLGFLGFPPFAVECYAMTNSFFLAWDKLRGTRSQGEMRCLCLLSAAVFLAFDFLVFAGIDAFTAVSFQDWP
jgi:hypothetical protein